MHVTQYYKTHAPSLSKTIVNDVCVTQTLETAVESHARIVSEPGQMFCLCFFSALRANEFDTAVRKENGVWVVTPLLSKCVCDICLRRCHYLDIKQKQNSFPDTGPI